MSYFHNSYVYHTHCINISIYQHSAIVLAVVSKFSGRKPHSLCQSSTSKSMLGSCFLRVGRDNSSKNKDTRNDLWQRFCWTTQPNNISTHSRFVIVQFWKPPVCIRWWVTNPLTRACSFVPFVLSFIFFFLFPFCVWPGANMASGSSGGPLRLILDDNSGILQYGPQEWTLLTYPQWYGGGAMYPVFAEDATDTSSTDSMGSFSLTFEGEYAYLNNISFLVFMLSIRRNLHRFCWKHTCITFFAVCPHHYRWKSSIPKFIRRFNSPFVHAMVSIATFD